MRSQLTRAFTVLATAASVALAGVGTAEAGGPGGNGSSSTTSAAAVVQTMREALVARVDKGDVPGTQASLGELAPVLTDLARGERYVIQAQAKETAVTARQDNAEAREGVDELAARMETQAGLPPVTAFLNALVQRLLLSLSLLVNDLLGGLTVPVG
ncbi:hypothetical protein ACIQUM_21090 [Amycolatopsis azurea]|uniref:hypothetical protein n=1 Tax=Amycolatopsis azurea TaxID=36819 RepID=UPI0038033BAD